MVFLSWLVSGAWTCHRSVVQIRHLYPPTELIEIYNLRPIPRPWHRDKAQLSSKYWRYEGPPTSAILLKNRHFTGLTIWIYAEFYGHFHCAIEKFPSPSKWWVISNLLFYKTMVQKKCWKKCLTHFFWVRILWRWRFRAQFLGLLGRKLKKADFWPDFFIYFLYNFSWKNHLKEGVGGLGGAS